jgi:tRNA(Ile)-lysidine synthase TilS/MesJ
MSDRTIAGLKCMQAASLFVKKRMSQTRIRDWFDAFGEDGVVVAFSGGKDSTVLLDMVRELYPNARAMFVDVPTQYPELRQFVKKFPNVDIVRPKINFIQVCEKYGFPFFSKEIAESIQGARKYLQAIVQECDNPIASKQASKHLTAIGTNE